MGLLDNKELLEDYRKHWSKRYGRELSDGELEEIYRNLNGFFNVLLDWRAADAKAAEQPQGNPEQLSQAGQEPLKKEVGSPKRGENAEDKGRP